MSEGISGHLPQVRGNAEGIFEPKSPGSGFESSTEEIAVGPESTIASPEVFNVNEALPDLRPMPIATKPNLSERISHTGRTLREFMKFIGPGFMVAVAYIDQGNYVTDAAAGAEARFGLLLILLLSNLIAIFFQTLCIKVGSVTGGTLDQVCRDNMPKYLYITLWVISELAIVATDVAGVWTAIAINPLFKINLIVCVGLTILDVFFVLLFYRPKGESKSLKVYECFVGGLVITVITSFCVELAFIKNTKAVDVFEGSLPSDALLKGNGLFLACGILGATVMPHSLFLGSGFVQSRLRQFDIDAGNDNVNVNVKEEHYKLSLQAINCCMKYGIAPYAATVFSLALLMSGLSAGLVTTVASQISIEGFMKTFLKPWVMRLVTRVLSIILSIAIAAASGRSGLGDALTASQVILSITLPFIYLPLVYFTGRKRYMTVDTDRAGSGKLNSDVVSLLGVDMKNSTCISVISWTLWGIVATMNEALLVLVVLGKGVERGRTRPAITWRWSLEWAVTLPWDLLRSASWLIEGIKPALQKNGQAGRAQEV